MSSPDFVIVGAGAIGAAAAYELARTGAQVLVLERSLDGSGCSYGSAGLVSPSHSDVLPSPASIRHGMAWMSRRDSPFHIRPRLDVVPWLTRFTAASLPARSAAASAILRALTTAGLEAHAQLVVAGLETSFTRRGILGVYESERTFALARARAADLNGSRPRTLSAAEARELVPGLAPGMAGALLHPTEGHCDPGRFVDALLGAARCHGAEVRTGVEVLGLSRRQGRIAELQTTGGPIACRELVLAAGTWTRDVGRTAGLHIPLEGGKGYHLEIPATRATTAVPAFLEDAHITATPLDGRVRFTGTLELSGLDLTVDPVRLDAIARAAERTIGARVARPVHVWRGLRPCAPDGLPIIGRAPGLDNVYVATGHAMLGIALAPVTGEIIRGLACGEQSRFDLEPLSPSRFRRIWPIRQNPSDRREIR